MSWKIICLVLTLVLTSNSKDPVPCAGVAEFHALSTWLLKRDTSNVSLNSAYSLEFFD